jgi:3-dehydrosphinganine reductase
MPPPPEPCDRYFEGKHVLVTGGSEGLGLALASRAVRGGAARVTLVARTQRKLDAAVEGLRREAAAAEGGSSSTTTTATTHIQAFSADVTDAKALAEAVRAAEQQQVVGGDNNGPTTTTTTTPVDILLACAGSAECGYFHEAAASGAFARQMQLNYLGVVHAVQAVYGGMVERAGKLGEWRRRRRRQGGDAAPPPPPPPKQQHILIVASAMSLLNFVGYAAYAPSKWALRGLAEGLRNELQGSGLGGGGEEGAAATTTTTQRRRGVFSSSSTSTTTSSDVRVTIAYPPDIDTPGYAAENRAKPPECARISEGSALFSADAVARSIVQGMAAGRFVAPNPSVVLALLQAVAGRGVVPASASSGFSGGWLGGWLGMPLDMLLGLVAPVVAAVAGAEHDGVARSGARGRFGRLWKAGGLGG